MFGRPTTQVVAGQSNASEDADASVMYYMKEIYMKMDLYQFPSLPLNPKSHHWMHIAFLD